MSKPVKVAFVMEGPTDYVVLRAAVRALLKERDKCSEAKRFSTDFLALVPAG
jgi:hypothetical protein